MNYFLKGLASGNKTYWAAAGIFSAWAVAIVDVFSYAFKPPGLSNGLVFKLVFILTILGVVGYFAYKYTADKKKEEKIKTVEAEAPVFEAEREEELRRILQENPEFATLCYQCIHFNDHLRHCAKTLSEDIAYKRVKEVRINNRKYCLYFSPSARGAAEGPSGHLEGFLP
ncbi:MAG: hypothetical protein GTO45_10095 [Candidatus Aminicenantes bacterium]|nr:hypothetical protein [Candidatus Aminicenantes bacterium]NIM79160.1 hypothetical protein [Candidatus Aminicenantes bacterium]NIN18445.1 hypothetical protein [Candidatus Aminicenantes bacterium]NIN42333.1 hypothetical protein [Candidatus Aminicenantes bacterium]NIN85099.1 hypothetical protein [Candidatus Aminicenantes bacterium]